MHSMVFVLISFSNYVFVQVKTNTPFDTVTTPFWSSTATPYLKGQEGQSTSCNTQDACVPQVVYECPQMHMKVCLQVNFSVKHHLSERY